MVRKSFYQQVKKIMYYYTLNITIYIFFYTVQQDNNLAFFLHSFGIYKFSFRIFFVNLKTEKSLWKMLIMQSRKPIKAMGLLLNL